jgi:hypothetical protein
MSQPLLYAEISFEANLPLMNCFVHMIKPGALVTALVKEKNTLIFKTVLCLLVSLSQLAALAQTNAPIRRPTSPSSPMYIVHIDTWVNPDPQKCIDLIPKEIRPYVVMNLSLSVSDFVLKKYPLTIVESWLRVCAENRIWAAIQPASGYLNNFPYTDIVQYEYFFRKYPNFIGYNFAEQCWGFANLENWLERLKLFTNLIKLGNKYGGYLIVSSTQTMNTPVNNAVAMLKLDPDFAATCKANKQNFIFCEKYTTSRGFYDIESTCLGAYLSGYCGNYGIRFDESGWGYYTPRANKPFPEASGIMPTLEHALLTGQTVIDGPELTWRQTIYQASNQTSADGYTSKAFNVFPQFTNVSLDAFRKILDKTVRIPSREEVIARTKIAIVNDISSGADRDKYSTPQSLFTALYAMDGEWDANNTWLKKTGRYPAIPIVYKSGTYETGGFSTVVNKSAYSQRWPTTPDKVNEFNNLFPAEYSGDIYAGRMNNTWITYNPYLDSNVVTTGSIPFKYNTCDSINLTYAPYTTGVISEYNNKLQLYLNNYNTVSAQLPTDVIKIYGSTGIPTYTLKDRDNHTASTATANWSNGVFTLTIMHNGPLDVTINCAGTATNRLTGTVSATITPPTMPAEYAGDRQYEAENFEYKNVTAGDSKTLAFYTAMGYLTFGTNGAASVKMKINALKTGTYQLRTRYSASGGDVTSIDLYINGVKVATPAFVKTDTDSTWMVNTQSVNLQAGANTILFSANRAGSYNINFDNIVVSGSGGTVYDFSNDIAITSAGNPPAEMMTLRSGTAGVVSYTAGGNSTSNSFKGYSGGFLNGTGVADLDLFPAAANYTVTWKEYYGTTGGKKGMLLRASGSTGSCPYATGMRQGYLFVAVNNSDNTVTLQPYIASAGGISPQQSFTSSFTVAANSACWYRATTFGNTLKFECSRDSLNWEGGGVATFVDNTYPSGNSQLVWGLGSNNFSWVMDNITYQASNLTASRPDMAGFEYIQDAGPSASQVLTVSGQSMSENAVVTASANFEVSLQAGTGYSNSLTLLRVADSLPATDLYVRMKAGLISGAYTGTVSIATTGASPVKVLMAGTVKLIKAYTFTDDAATTSASNPPAANISVATGNTATAGIVTYTDAGNSTSNRFRAYSGGQRNATGAMNLDLFPSDATDYSVTWKQSVGTASIDYKAGVLLRGAAPEGTATTGYVQGLKQGYVFIAYTANGATTKHSEFRIYRSTSATSLSTLVNTSVNSLVPALAQSIWYRATATGSSPVSLKLEYSTDSITWNSGATYTDATATAFTSGSSQLVWGLGTPNYNFYLDDITLNSMKPSGVLVVSATALTNFNYIQNAGPSPDQLFTVSGNLLPANVVINAPENFEISLTAGSGYADALTLVQSGGAIPVTNVYARLKAGLTAQNYEGDLSFVYSGITASPDKTISLSGVVSKPEITVITPSAYNDLGYISGYGSVERTFIVSGNSLSQNLEIKAPADFEISFTPGSGYADSLTLAPINGTVASTTVYVRLKSGLSGNTYSGDLSLTSTGAASKNTTLNGRVYQQAITFVSETALGGFNYNYYSTSTSPEQPVEVWGGPLAGDITVTAPENFEVSLSPGTGYTTSIVLPEENGTVVPTSIYTRLKPGLAENNYTGNITITSNTATDKLVALSGTVSWNRIYDFSNDVATTAATPGASPALDITIGSGNSTTAGVVSYTDAAQNTSNRFRAYSGGNRNGTGIVDLNLFPVNATDYAVTWKQSIGSVTDYKVGCLLRGNGAAGTATTGYVQGMLNGYVFIVYNAGSARTEFRIYRSTSATSLSTLVNTTVASYIPAVGQSVWYRASAFGTSPVNLKLEYSTDSINWNNGAVAMDATPTAFTSGSTQLVWGLASPGFNFYMDDITYKTQPAIQLDSNTILTYDGQPRSASGFAYGMNEPLNRLSPELSFVYKDSVGNVLPGAPVTAATYKVVAFYGGNSKYLPARDSALMTILPRALTVQATGQTKECATELDLGTTAFTADGLVANDTISSVSLFSTGSSLSSSVGSYPIVASDAQGTRLVNYTITYVNGTLVVQDTTKPVPVLAQLPKIKIECGDTIREAPKAIDNCADTITATTTNRLTYNKPGKHTITWKYDDGNGNVTLQTQTVVVRAKPLPCHYCPNNNDVYGSVILSKIRIYPNPAQDIINIQLGKAGNRIYKIAVIDLAGRIMLQKEVKAPSNVVIPISQLQSGIYLIRLTGDKIMTFKIVKQ